MVPESFGHSLCFLIHKEAVPLTTLQLQNYLTITPIPPVLAPDGVSQPQVLSQEGAFSSLVQVCTGFLGTTCINVKYYSF